MVSEGGLKRNKGAAGGAGGGGAGVGGGGEAPSHIY